MPGWGIHLEVGERLSKKLKFAGEDKELFLLGCILPDINNGYVNKVRVQMGHGETHWAFNQKSSLNFYAKYKKDIDERSPVFLGYLVHLYTDGFFNYDFYRNVKHSDFAGLAPGEKSEVKHNDFWKYDLKFEGLNFFVRNKRAACCEANKIEGIDVNEEEIANIEEIIGDKRLNEQSRAHEYKFYTEERLDEVMDEMIESFTGDYL